MEARARVAGGPGRPGGDVALEVGRKGVGASDDAAACLEAAVALTAWWDAHADELTARWDEDSALERMAIGALAAHAARAVSTPLAYLDADPPGPADRLVTAAGYVVAVLGEAEPDDELHVGIRQRAAAAAAAGPDACRRQLEADVGALRARLDTEPPGRTLAVRDGIALTLDEYLRSRVVELVVHLDDLAASLGVVADVPERPAAVAVAVLADLARLRNGWPAVVRSLARRERSDGPVRAL